MSTSIPLVNDVDSLRELAPDSMFIGAAANLGDLNKDSEYKSTLAAQYNLITAENECKWGATEPNQNDFDFSSCDALGSFASENNMTFRGHNLCWGMYNPSWLESLSPADKKAALINHIQTTVSHFDGLIKIWDVVNEAVNDTATGHSEQPLKESTWYPDVPDFVTVAFETARASCEHCQLFYNDYSIASMYGYTAHKSDAVYELVKGMVEAGTPIDGVGIQFHIDLSFSDELINGTRDNIKRIGELGLDVHVTELDIACGSYPDYACPEWTEELEQQQGELYAELLQVCLDSPYCKNFETWGLTDKYTWLTSVYGQDEYPLPFDEDLKPKAAFDSMVGVLKEQ